MLSPVKIGIAGLGRSGWNIHALTLEELSEKYQVVAAMDMDPNRRQEAQDKFGAATYDSFEALIANPNAEAIVVATPNKLHKEHVIAALRAGKHVICEKPFGTTSAEADEMIAVAQESGKLVAPFQNRRYESHFEKVHEVIRSGVLGEIHQIRITQHNFARRWDWQTLLEFSGGQLLNTGPHIVDQALQLLELSDSDPDPKVTVDMRNVLSSGDAEDHIKLILQAPNRPLIDIEISAAMAYPQDRWLIAGKNGGLRGSVDKLEWRWVQWSKFPERPVERTPTPGRSYNNEALEWDYDSWLGTLDFHSLCVRFYSELFNSIREGAPLDITPQSVRRQIAVIEKAKELGGF